MACRLSFGSFLLCLLFALCGIARAKKPNLAHDKDKEQLRSFFQSLDKDGDGSIEPNEAMKYIEGVGGEELDTAQERSDAFDSMLRNLDSPSDKGQADQKVTQKEIQEHIARLSKSHRVVDWVKWGIGLPQYADAFRNNSVVVSDFLLLINDGGRILEEDFGVSSSLHRQKLLRGMKRQLLALGQLPSAPRDLMCVAEESTAGITLTWRPPEFTGQPALQRFVLERRPDGRRSLGQGWTVVAEFTEESETGMVDEGMPDVGTYSYRLAAWSEFGPSPYATVEGCHVTTLCALPPSPPSPGSNPQLLTPTSVTAVHDLASAAGNHKNAGAAAAAAALFAADPSADPSTSGARKQGPVRRALLFSALQWLLRALYTTLVIVGSLTIRSTWALTRLQILARWILLRWRGEVGDSSSLPLDPEPTPSTPPLRASATSPLLDSVSDAPLAPSPARASGLEPFPSAPADLPATVSLPNFSKVAALSLATAPNSAWASYDGDYGSVPGMASMNEDGSPVLLADSPTRAQQKTDIGCCSHPGCPRRLGRFRFGLKKQHFCGMCERWFCQEHTAYVTHGPMSRCELESRCACLGCLPLLPEGHPAKAAARSKQAAALTKQASTSKGSLTIAKSSSVPALSGLANGGGAGANGSGSNGNRGSGRPSPSERSGGGRGKSPGAGPMPPPPPLQLEGVDPAMSLDRGEEMSFAFPSPPGGGSPGGAECATPVPLSRGENARKNWAKGRSKILAVIKFRHAGEERRSRDGFGGKK